MSLFTQDGPWVRLYVVEEKPMQAGLVTVNSAASLSADISRTGHASVYGIYFDNGKAEVKPESDATLKEIAKLLQSDPGLKLYVVGHTDNQGALDMNIDLSRRRAESVVTVLTTRYGAAPGRPLALGDGPSAPVASNDTEEGRAKIGGWNWSSNKGEPRNAAARWVGGLLAGAACVRIVVRWVLLPGGTDPESGLIGDCGDRRVEETSGQGKVRVWPVRVATSASRSLLSNERSRLRAQPPLSHSRTG